MEQYGYDGQAPTGQMPNQQIQGDQVPPQAVDDGTKTVGILSIIFAFLMPLVGLILAIVGTNKAKKILKDTGVPAQGAGYLQAGLVCSIVVMSLILIYILVIVFMLIAAFGLMANEVNETDYGNSNNYYATDNCGGESCAKIIKGDWNCYDGTSSISGYEFDEDGNIIGHDGSKQNPEILRRYEFGYSSVYAYDMKSEAANNLRGSYTSALYEEEADGKFEYELTVKFSEFMSAGESLDEYIGKEAVWNVVVNPDEQDMMGLGMGGNVYECRRVD